MSRGGLPLAACAAASLLAHAALIGTLGGLGPPGGRPGAPGPATVLHASVRILEPTQPAPVAAEPAAVVVAAAHVAPELATLKADVAPLPSIEPPAPEVAAPAAGGDDFDGYVPRALLSVPPEVKGTAEISWPDAPGLPDGHYHENFTLYIDETGTVRRVEAEGDGLPAPLLERARQTFLAARFEPGQVKGRIVKSRIRIAVDFESHATAISHRF